MHQPGAYLRQRRLQLLACVDGILQVQRLGFFHQRADPVGLPTLGHPAPHVLHHLVAARIGNQLGRHRLAPRRQLVDHRHVQIGIEGHRQRARDRRRRHHQLVRQETALPAQRQPLRHAEAVLLVHDGQRQPGKDHRILDQRMRADQHVHLAGGHRLLHPALGGCPQRTGQPAHPHAQRLQPGREPLIVLPRQDLGRGHQRGLPAGAHRHHRRQRGNDRLAATHVALQQPVHGLLPRQVGRDLVTYPALRTGERKRQRGQQCCLTVAIRQRLPPLARPQLARPSQRQLLRHQLFQDNALAGWRAPLQQSLQISPWWRMMDEPQRFQQWWKPRQQ